MPGCRGTLKERLYRRLVIPEDPDACWGWTGPLEKTGYGMMTGHSPSIIAHRVSYIVHNGDIPEGLNICHNCHNPPCCNPKHLRADTQSENIRDQVRIGTHSHQKLTLDQVAAIRQRAAAGEMLKDLAAEYGVDPSSISRVVRGKTFANL